MMLKLPKSMYFSIFVLLPNLIKIKPSMKKFTLVISFVCMSLILMNCAPKSNDPCEEETFSFAFLTDIHIQPESNATEGFRAAVAELNTLNPDFVITGGDLIMDALGASYGRADSLYNIYLQEQEAFNMPVYKVVSF